MTIIAKTGAQLHIGRVGENLATKVVFDISNWITEFGQGTITLIVQQNGLTYPQLTTTNGSEVTWEVTNSNTTVAGRGKCELQYIVDSVIVKSAIYDIIVTNSLGAGEDEPPAPYQSWVDEIIQGVEYVRENAELIVSAVEEVEATKDEVLIIRTEVNKTYEDTLAAGVTATESVQEIQGVLEDVSNLKGDVEQLVNTATLAKNDAITAKDEALSYQNSAEAAKTAAEAARDRAEISADTSTQNANTSATARDTALTAQDAALAAQRAAETAQASTEGAAELIKDEAEEAEAWAAGTRGGVNVGIDDPAFQNNAKYYKDQARAISGGDFVTPPELTTTIEGHNTDPNAHQDLFDNISTVILRSWTASDVSV